MKTRHEWDEEDIRPGSVVEMDEGLAMICQASGMIRLLPKDRQGAFLLVGLAYGNVDPLALTSSEMAAYLTEKNAAPVHEEFLFCPGRQYRCGNLLGDDVGNRWRRPASRGNGRHRRPGPALSSRKEVVVFADYAVDSDGFVDALRQAVSEAVSARIPGEGGSDDLNGLQAHLEGLMGHQGQTVLKSVEVTRKLTPDGTYIPVDLHVHFDTGASWNRGHVYHRLMKGPAAGLVVGKLGELGFEAVTRDPRQDDMEIHDESLAIEGMEA